VELNTELRNYLDLEGTYEETYLLFMISTYGCNPPLLASIPLLLLGSNIPSETPFEIAFISV
jgi:hypothetical protein